MDLSRSEVGYRSEIYVRIISMLASLGRGEECDGTSPSFVFAVWLEMRLVGLVVSQ